VGTKNSIMEISYPKKRRATSADEYQSRSKIQKQNENLEKTNKLQALQISQLKKENEDAKNEVVILKKEMEPKFQHIIVNTASDNEDMLPVEMFMDKHRIEPAQPNSVIKNYRALGGVGIHKDTEVLKYWQFPRVVSILNQLRRFKSHPEDKSKMIKKLKDPKNLPIKKYFILLSQLVPFALISLRNPGKGKYLQHRNVRVMVLILSN